MTKARMFERFTDWWRKLRDRDDDEVAGSHEYDPEWRELLVQYSLRIAVVFAILFGAVFGAFRWSGAAVRFGAQRAGGNVAPTWRVRGVVRDAQTLEPVPWARVEDDPGGQPPLFFAEADRTGRFELLTLAEPHRVLVSAPNYRDISAAVGRAWYLWVPRGEEYHELKLGRK